MQRPYTFARFAVAVGAVLLSNGAFAGKPLFRGGEKPSAQALNSATRVARESTTASLRVLQADASVVDKDSREIDLDLGFAKVQLLLDQATETPSGSLIWSGRIKNSTPASLSNQLARDEQNAATLVRRGNAITGNIRYEGHLFQIRPLPDGSHAVIKVDESKMPPDHEPGSSDLRSGVDAARPLIAPSSAAASTDTGDTVIRVSVFATSDAVSDYTGDMPAMVDLAVAESNQGYRNSGINIALQLAGYHEVTYTESSDSRVNLDRFADPSDDDLGSSASAIRAQDQADVAVLIVKPYASCGTANAIGATASTAFAMVSHMCATGNYSFAHEIGHLQGARHDPATDSSITPYEYGHGYWASDNSWRTIMAYPCGGSSCPRLNYWSNPNISYNGEAMGDTTVSNNARVLNETRGTVATFRSTLHSAQ